MDRVKPIINGFWQSNQKVKCKIAYQASDDEISLFSILVYFNGNFQGGETRFMEQIEATVKPIAGKVAIFQHKIRHEGCEVIKGTKYAVRTDVIYKKTMNL